MSMFDGLKRKLSNVIKSFSKSEQDGIREEARGRRRK